MPIAERPIIAGTTPLKDGYMARSLCLVDGLPAEVHIQIDTETPKYSEFWISVWNPLQMTWTSRIYQLRYEEVGHIPPLLIAEPEAMAILNTAAELLWHAASEIIRAGRERQEDLDAACFVRENRLLDHARAAELPMSDTAEPEQMTLIERGEVVAEPGDPEYLNEAELDALRSKLAGDS